MPTINEFAACVVVALIGATLAVTACAIFMLLKEGRGALEHKGNQLLHGVSRLLSTGLADKSREP